MCGKLGTHGISLPCGETSRVLWSQVNRLFQSSGHSGKNWNDIIWPLLIHLLLILTIALKVGVMNSTSQDNWLAHSQMNEKGLKHNPTQSLSEELALLCLFPKRTQEI